MNRIQRITTAIVAFAAIAMAGCGTDPPDSSHEPSDRQPATSQPQLTLEEEFAATLLGFQEAVHRYDVQEIVAFFSDRYESNEASGRAEVTEWWTNVIDSGLADRLPLDPATATITIHDHVAEVHYYDTNGELACRSTTNPCEGPQRYLDFRFRHDANDGWLITGIPSEG